MQKRKERKIMSILERFLKYVSIDTTSDSSKKQTPTTENQRLLASLLPEEFPENTEGYEGFYHLKSIDGTMSEANMKYLIRAFDKNEFENRKKVLNSIVEKLNAKYHNCIKCEITDSYYNIYEVVNAEPALIDGTKTAIKDLGIEYLQLLLEVVLTVHD